MSTGVAQRTRSPLLTIARDPLLRRAGTALALYRIAEFGPWIAMLVFAYANGGATAAGVVSLALLVPTALFAPFAGALIDRYGASGTLVGGYTMQAFAMGTTAVTLLVGAPPVVSYLLGAVTATVLTVTHSAHAVMSPGIARTTEQLVALNAITGWILSVGLIVAPAVAGLILEVSTPGAVYALGALCLAGAAVVVFPLRGLVPPLARPETERRRPGPIRELGEGARALTGEAATREVLLVLAATFLMVGAFDVLAVVLAVGVLGLGGSGAGYLTALHGAGAVIGAGMSFALIGRARIMPLLLGAAFLSGAGFVVLGIATLLPVALVVAAVAGISRSLLEVSAATLLQRVTPTALLARVFAFKEGLAMAAWGLGSIMVPGLIALGGVRLALIGTGAIVPIIVLTRFSRLLHIDAVATVPVVAIALLRSMRIFRALPVPALEGIARGVIEVPVAGGTSILKQGETGDRYYAIADGTVEVTIDGRLVATLDRGEGFGEIALLHETPRTASVTAKTDALLLAIEREPFLVALIGHSESEARLTAIVDERLPAVR
jgi:MFS family permease